MRRASRLATGLNAAWTAVYGRDDVGPGHRRQARQPARQAVPSRRAARRRHHAASGQRLPDEILRLARRENVTQIVLGQSRAGLLARLRRPLAAGSDHAPRRRHRGPYRRLPSRRSRRNGRGSKLISLEGARRRGRLAALGSVACAVVVGDGAERGSEAAQPLDDLPHRRAVLRRALRHAAPRSSPRSLSFVAYNFFFIQPLYTFTVAAAAGTLRAAHLPGRRGPRPGRWPGACATSARR